MTAPRNIHIGCQSWGYDDWISPAAGGTVFYPSGTKRDEMLGLYARVFSTIEVDSTLYGTPQSATIAKWYEQTPPGFLFSLKMPREVTHDGLLAESTYDAADEFIDRARLLGSKLGMILVQMPPAFEPLRENAAHVRRFVARLPRDIRFTMEFRHAGWFNDWTYDELGEAGVSLTLVEGKWVQRELMFASLVKLVPRSAYVRFMGERDLPKFDCIQRERTETLELWAKVLQKVPADDVFVYFDNYFEGHAPATANRMSAMLGLAEARPELLEDQPSLF